MQSILVMVNGLPGHMAAAVAHQVNQDPELDLLPASLTGAEITADSVRIGDLDVTLIRPNDREAAVRQFFETRPQRLLIAVDFTHPTAVNENAAFYCRWKIPFVMGTTGGDRDALMQTVRNAQVPAVIAPNMAKQIVGFQAMMAYAADNFPGLFKGYRLAIRESHQQGKADTSGTAKAMVGYFNRLGIPFEPSDITQERDPAVQKNRWGVPEEHLGGHGWHTYTLTSPDGTVHFEFTHNVNGRKIYAGGTLDAVKYLAAKIARGNSGTFTMIDVLKGS